MEIGESPNLSHSTTSNKEMLKSAQLRKEAEKFQNQNILTINQSQDRQDRSYQSYTSKSTDHYSNLLFPNKNEENKMAVASKKFCKILDSKKSLKRMLGVDNFENQKTQKQNIDYLRENYLHEDGMRTPGHISDNLNIIGNEKNRRNSGQRVEYRERNDSEKGYHKKSKSHRNRKYQYIRNNHDIISKHQRNRSSDSSENSILRKSNGFEILYQRGEKMDKLLGNYDSVEEYSRETSYQQDLESILSSSRHGDSSSSISHIGKVIA